jgi:tight adherence protein B
MIDLLVLVALLTCIAWGIRFRTVTGVFELSPAPITRTLRVLGIESGHPLILISLVFAAIAVTFFIQEVGSLGIIGVIVTGLVTLVCLIGILFLLAARRVRKFEVALPEAVELIKATSRSGGTAQSALTAVAQSTEGILGKEFKWMSQALQHGASIEQATQRLNHLYGTHVVKLFVQALITKWQVGGNLSELM